MRTVPKCMRGPQEFVDEDGRVALPPDLARVLLALSWSQGSGAKKLTSGRLEAAMCTRVGVDAALASCLEAIDEQVRNAVFVEKHNVTPDPWLFRWHCTGHRLRPSRRWRALWLCSCGGCRNVSANCWRVCAWRSLTGANVLRKNLILGAHQTNLDSNKPARYMVISGVATGM